MRPCVCVTIARLTLKCVHHHCTSDASLDLPCYPSVLFLQEKDVAAIQSALKPFFPWSYWTCSQGKLGYSGCAVLSKVTPFSLSLGGQRKDPHTGR